ncbi:MAG TPA: antitoxin family protein [Herpetosiphonaceae bacterium]|nr:antitoxin family protein [Herpetosiphonaceae bacterium]
MSQTIDAIFDGKVFQPAGPVELEPNTRVRVTIEPVVEQAESKSSFLRTARALNLQGPADWSTHVEDYLYDQEPDGNGQPLP